MKDRSKRLAVHPLEAVKKALPRCLCTLLAVIAPLASAAEAPDWLLLVEPKFMRPEVYFPIAGAERSVLVPARMKGGAPEYITARELERLGIQKGALAAKARANASRVLEGLKPDFSRDENGVIEYAELRSDEPVVASAVIASDFAKRFEPLFGPELLVVIPNRHQAFIFPKLASTIRKYGPMFIEAYKESAFPVSLEVFEVTSEDMRAVGTFDPK